MKAMLFTEVIRSEAEHRASEPWSVVEQKFDGARMLARMVAGRVEFLQRNGAQMRFAAALVKLPQLEEHIAKALSGTNLYLDGEVMPYTGEYRTFDLIDPERMETPYVNRRERLHELVDSIDLLRPVSSFSTITEKKQLITRVESLGGEGVMIKDLRAGYEPGVRVKHSVKCKFTKTADVIVTWVDRPDQKHGSIQFGVYSPTTSQIEVLGRCSAIGKPEIRIGDVIEVAYLYRQENGGLIQPRMLQVRSEKSAYECTADQFPNYTRDEV